MRTKLWAALAVALALSASVAAHRHDTPRIVITPTHVILVDQFGRWVNVHRR
tara:strand:+ start:4758 stop:4913 length:156 start_codon:yes stop_codon:yes gene_type:complete